MEVLGLSLFPFQKNWQVRMADQAMYHQGNQRASSLVVDSGPCYHPLLSKKFYIFTDGSHTHRHTLRYGSVRNAMRFDMVMKM